MADKAHSKHAKLPRAGYGEWGRAEVALLGAPCGLVQALAEKIALHFGGRFRIGFADAWHKAEAAAANPFFINYSDRVGQHHFAFREAPAHFRRHQLFGDCDLVLVNGNHFTAARQIVLLHPEKSLAHKLERLTDVKLAILCGGVAEIPEYLKAVLDSVSTIPATDEAALMAFFENLLEARIPVLNGLVLAGGKSLRMGQDKRLLQYHKLPQQEHAYRLLEPHCREVFVSCNAAQRSTIPLPLIEDRFLGLGPMAGILAAFQSAPDAAWLTVACDLPFLSESLLQHLIRHRDPSRMATAFLDGEGRFPEPLITIWEPRAHGILLQALSEGYSCPRKVLINSDIALLTAPDPSALRNINDPAAMQSALTEIQHKTSSPSGHA